MVRVLKAISLALAIGLSACQSYGDRTSMSEQTRAAGTNQSFSHTVTTAASADAIWRLWTDVSTWKNWDKGLKDAEIDGPFQLGAQGKIIPLSGPASRFEVTDYDEGSSYAFETRLPLARLRVERTLISENPTIFRHDVSFEGFLGGFWAGRFGPGFREALPPTMQTLATLAEES